MGMTLEAPLYIYAVCQLPSEGLVLPLGIEQETVLVRVADLGAIAEPAIDLQALQEDDQRLLTAVLTHDRVIAELFQQTTLLPLRFGIQLAGLQSVEIHLRDNQERYRQRLAALAGKAEYQIKLTPLDIALAPLPEGLPGREYFLAKKLRLQEQAAAQQRQQDALNYLLSQIQAAYPNLQAGEPDENGAVRLYLLLSLSGAESLLQSVEIWQRQSPYWQLSLSEALPPYHFVG
ncbi:MAG TPA: GvpL/GvpF family gas vesicle protein [Trichocoleus sp.]